MLQLTIEFEEFFNEKTQEFEPGFVYKIELEHSLVAISKWESVFEKPFLSDDEKTPEELLAYIKAMTLTPNIPLGVFENLSEKNIQDVNAYINSKHSATWFGERKTSPSREIITSELIYFWMIAMNIPIECQHWHLNRLLTLIKIWNVKNSPEKKMSQRELAERNRALNAERKKALGTKG